MDELTKLETENNHLRAALANSKDPCIYCQLPAEEMAKCQSGFPGCGRADDMQGCPEFGASIEARDIKNKLLERNTKHLARCEKECTRNVIFLFQRRRYILHGVPDGWEVDPYGEGNVRRTETDDGEDIEVDRRGDGMTPREFFALGLVFGDWDASCVTEEYETESVWLDRDEAEKFGRVKSYNYPDGWRVYGVCAEGELAELIRGDVP